MHVFIVEVTHEDGTSFIHQVMDSPRGAFESMREYASSIDADILQVTDTRWELFEGDTGLTVAVIESLRRPVMRFEAER